MITPTTYNSQTSTSGKLFVQLSKLSHTIHSLEEEILTLACEHLEIRVTRLRSRQAQDIVKEVDAILGTYRDFKLLRKTQASKRKPRLIIRCNGQALNKRMQKVPKLTLRIRGKEEIDRSMKDESQDDLVKKETTGTGNIAVEHKETIMTIKKEDMD